MTISGFCCFGFLVIHCFGSSNVWFVEFGWFRISLQNDYWFYCRTGFGYLFSFEYFWSVSAKMEIDFDAALICFWLIDALGDLSIDWSADCRLYLNPKLTAAYIFYIFDLLLNRFRDGNFLMMVQWFDWLIACCVNYIVEPTRW